MRNDLVKPCDNCPFRNNGEGIKLSPGRIRELARTVGEKEEGAMGWSCRADAAKVLDAWSACCRKATGQSNVFHAGDRATCREHLGYYKDWRAKGGFEPPFRPGVRGKEPFTWIEPRVPAGDRRASQLRTMLKRPKS